MPHLVIIGNGITGTTIARHVRKNSDMKITMISAESDYFFSRTALMYIFMGHMRLKDTMPYENWFWKKNRIRLIKAVVTDVDFNNQQVILQNQKKISYDQLVIATGSNSNKFGWPGQELDGVQGLYSLQDLALLEENIPYIQNAVIVGGGLIGVELGEMLHSRHIPVTFLVREDRYWGNILPKEEARLVENQILDHGIKILFSTQLKEILPDKSGRVAAVVTDKNQQIDCQFVGLTAGVHPNIELFKSGPLQTNRGIVVNEYLETNIENIYAAGDCAELQTNGQLPGRVEQLWYTGRLQAEALSKTLTGVRTKYERGTWFNSAKFFNLEFQTYGFVPNEKKEGFDSFYWQNEEKTASLRLVFDKANRIVSGMNVFGIRMRHELWQRWLNEKRTVNYVLQNLPAANFDPEFYWQFEQDIIQKAKSELNLPELKSTIKRGLFSKIPGLIPE